MMISPEVEAGRSGSGEPRNFPVLSAEVVAVLKKLSEQSPLRDQLRAFRRDLGLRDRELCELADVSRATFSRWKKEGDGERPVALDDLRVISSLLIRSGAMRPRSVAGWLRSRNEGLRLERPLGALKAGQFSSVLSAAEAACGGRLPIRQPSGQLALAPPLTGSAAHGSSG